MRHRRPIVAAGSSSVTRGNEKIFSATVRRRDAVRPPGVMDGGVEGTVRTRGRKRKEAKRRRTNAPTARGGFAWRTSGYLIFPSPDGCCLAQCLASTPSAPQRVSAASRLSHQRHEQRTRENGGKVSLSRASRVDEYNGRAASCRLSSTCEPPPGVGSPHPCMAGHGHSARRPATATQRRRVTPSSERRRASCRAGSASD